MINANESNDDVSTYRGETHHVHYDPATATTPSETLIHAIADIADESPLGLEPLYETVDPDTVDEFVGSNELPEVSGQITFTFEHYDVTVHASGLFEIEPAS